jgi:hypothetical protein
MRGLLLTCAALALGGLAWALDDDVEGWIKDLGSADPKTRESAAENLEKAGERARPALESAVNSEDPEVASEANHLLKRLSGGPRDQGNKTKPQPGRRPMVRMSSTRVIVDRNGNTTSIQEDSAGRVIVKETKDGNTEEFAAESREAFTEKYPEVAKRYGLDKDASGLSLLPGKGTPEEEELQKQIEELRRQAEEKLKKKQEEKLPGSRRMLGVATAPVDDALRYQLDIPEGGLLIESVEKGSLAERLGIREYDILLALNGKPISSATDIRAALEAEGPATAEIVREGERETLREKE